MIVGLQGYAGVGKDSVADILVEDFGFTKLSFSDAVHAALMALNPIITIDNWGTHRYADFIHAYGYVRAKEYLEVRRLLQRMGTEVGRQIIGEDTWVNFVRDELVEWPGAVPQDFVIANVRFVNEAQMIKSTADDLDTMGFLVTINRPGFGPVNDHASEDLPVVPDFQVSNDGSLQDLRTTVNRLHDELTRWRDELLLRGMA